MINLGASQRETSFVGKLLKHVGLPTDLGAAIAALASTIRDHKHLENLLTGIGAQDRQDMYEAIRPHLRFIPKPLDAYVASVGQRAEREQWPTIGEGGKLEPFKPAADVDTLKRDVEQMIAAAVAKRTLTLTCVKCLTEETFYQIGEETRVGVLMRVRKAGWVHDPKRETETCPKCAAGPLPYTPKNQPQVSDL